MNTFGPRSPRPSRAGAAGYTLLAVLLAVAVMAGLVATYGRHVIVAGRGGMASPTLLATREACQSGLAYARQGLVSGEGLVATSVPTADSVASVSVVHTSGGHDVMSVEAVGADGLGARRKAELALQPVAVTAPIGPESLPGLDFATVAGLLSNGALPKIQVTQDTRLEGVEVTGLLVVHPGAELQLDDVVLHGAVVSSTVLNASPASEFVADAAPTLLVDGNVRIDPPDALPGLAILLPDGRVSSGVVDARVQIHGDVVAHDISLLHEGALYGHVLGVNVSLAPTSLLDRYDSERKPADWSPVLDLGAANEPVFLAALPTSTSLGSLSGIVDYWSHD